MLKKYTVIYNAEDLEKIPPHSGYIYADTENTGLNPYSLTPLLLGLKINNEYFILVLTYLDTNDVSNFIDAYKDCTWVFHNAKYDIKIIKRHYGILLKKVICTYLQEKVLRNNWNVSFSYEETAKRYMAKSDYILENYNITIPKITLDKTVVKLFINRNVRMDFTKVEFDYLYEDILFLEPLEKIQTILIDKFEIEITKRIENEVAPFVALIELNGIRIDFEQLMEVVHKWELSKQSILDDFKQKILDINEFLPLLDKPLVNKKGKTKQETSLFANSEMYDSVRVLDSMNFNSHVQLLEIFKRADVFIPSTGKDELELFKLYNPKHKSIGLVESLLKYRTVEKNITTYGVKFLEYEEPATGRTHPEYLQIGAVTGRFSSNNYNIQNIPPSIKHCFVPDNQDYVFVDSDLSGQEVRLLASMSGEPTLVKTFTEGLDMHSILAQNSYRIINNDNDFVITSEINSNLRTNHKPVFFGWVYGAGYQNIAGVLNITQNVAKRVLSKLESTLPLVTRFQNGLKSKGVTFDYIRDQSFTNRLKWVNGDNVKAVPDYKKEKEACNFPMQASGASMMKLAIILLSRHIIDNNLDWQIKATVHDELIVQVPRVECEKSADIIQGIMEKAGNFFLSNGLKMKSSRAIGEYWTK